MTILNLIKRNEIHDESINCKNVVAFLFDCFANHCDQHFRTNGSSVSKPGFGGPRFDCPNQKNKRRKHNQ